MITPCGFDLQLFEWLNFNGGPAVDNLMVFLSGKLTWVPLYMFILWLVVRSYGWKRGLLWLALAAVMVLFADQTCTFAKTHFPKFRPSHYPPLMGDAAGSLVHTVGGYVGGLYGTISSHAANSMGFAMMSYFTLRHQGLMVKWIGVALAVWVLLVCYSRIYLGVHYPVDIFLGLLVGSFWGYGLYVLFKKIISLKYEKNID